MIHIASDLSKSKITNINEKCIQPNAVDLKLSRVFELSGEFLISEQTKQHRDSIELFPVNGFFELKSGKSYNVILDHDVVIAEGEAGWVIPRSTLNRNGVFITSGLYDSGYDGMIGGCIHVNGGDAKIEEKCRIGQFILVEAETLHLYDGDYNKK